MDHLCTVLNSGLNPCSPIALPIEVVHLEPPRSGHLSTLDNGQAASTQKTVVSVQVYLRERMDIETASKNRDNKSKFSTSVAQIVCLLLCCVDFVYSLWFSVRSKLLMQLLPGHTPLPISDLGLRGVAC